MALKRLRFMQRRKALGYTQEGLAEQLGVERTTVIRWERGETEPQPWLRPRICQVLQLSAVELHQLLDDVAEVPGHSDGFGLVSTVPLDFSLSAASTVRVLEGFSAHDIASRWQALAQLAVLTSTAILHTDEPRQWQHYAARAEVHSLRARHSRGGGYVRSRVFDEIRLARVRLAQRDPAEAVAVGVHALQLAEDARSSLIIDWFIRFDRNLTERYPKQAETADFHEHVRQYVRKAAPLRAGELS